MVKTAVTPIRFGGYYVITDEGDIAWAATSHVLSLDEAQVAYLEDLPPEERALMVAISGDGLDAETLYQYAMSVKPGILQRIWTWVRNS